MIQNGVIYMKRKLELYGTLGPADHSGEILHEMFQAGMTGLRLNLSHTNLRECEPWLHTLHAVAEKRHIVPDLLIDLQGPEVRIGALTEPLLLLAGNTARLCPVSAYSETDSAVSGGEHPACPDSSSSDKTEQEKAIAAIAANGVSAIDAFPSLTVSRKTLPSIPVPDAVFPYFKEGQTLRLDDGKIILTVKSVDAALPEAETVVVTGGLLSSRKSLAIDGVSVELPTLTAQDLENLRILDRYRVTGVMLPFVRSGEDLLNLRKALLEYGHAHVRIFAKIENRRGVEQLSSLLPHCDQIVIARGDLGNAYPLPQLPAIQKQIARTCLAFKKPFMVVTQMLASMEEHPVPTRAEVSDIFNAVLDGASSLMLTGETAAGKYPAKAMQVLSDTAFEALRYRMEAKFFL